MTWAGTSADGQLGGAEHGPSMPQALAEEVRGDAGVAETKGELAIEGGPGSGLGHALADEQWPESRVTLVRGDGLTAMGAAAVAHGYLWVRLGSPGPEYRGRLGLYIEECIEGELEARGAIPPGIQASTGLDASLSDQLYRARLVEQRGIALGVPRLDGIASLGRTLDADDSAVLRWWMAAASERPVWLVLDEGNKTLRVYPSPVLFETLFDVAPAPVSPRPPSLEMASSAEAMQLSDLPPEVAVSEPTEPDADLGRELEEELTAGDELERTDVDAVVEAAPARAEVSYSYSASPLAAAVDVDLPDLDAALGLTPEPVQPSPLPPALAPRVPLITERVAAVTMPPSEVLASSAAFLPSREAPVAAEPGASEPARSRGESLGADEDGFDADEFLRVLAEDASQQPAEVASDVSQDEALDDDTRRSVEQLTPEAPSSPGVSSPRAEETTPLPTKRISSKLFIRMAEPGPAVAPAETGSVAPAVGSSVPEAAARAAASSSDVPSALFEAEELVDASATSDLAGRALIESEPARRVSTQPVDVDLDDPFSRLAIKEWKTWKTNLEAARGPRPLAAVERMFVTDYTRLREAVRRGIADESAVVALDEWQSSFASSYEEAFEALRVRGKRPTMVLDLPEMAQRLGRLQGARRVQLLMVDGMRFDLGLMIQERLKACVDAALTERLLLWSCLPTTTENQLELLGKGADGLKEEVSAEEHPALVARGRAAETPRRVRTGRLEIHKLDTIEDALRVTGRPVSARLGEIADVTARAVAEHLAKQSPRTLVVVFGDHGFLLDPRQAGTLDEVRQGGASPEEVLVPAFAWLTGAVH